MSIRRQIGTVALIFVAMLTFVASQCLALTVEIITPSTDPFSVPVNQSQEFEAVAFSGGVELESGDVTWDWDFGDDSDHATDNPTSHIYTETGDYVVTVTAEYSSEQAQDSISAEVLAPEFANFDFFARPGLGDRFGAEVCDQTDLVVRCPAEGAHPFTAKFYARLPGEEEWGDPWHPGTVEPELEIEDEGEYLAASPTTWPTALGKNEKWEFRVEVTITIAPPPPPGRVITGDLFDHWTPNNTVVKSGSDVILHHAEEAHQITWSIEHLDFDNPTFDMTIHIYGLSGDDPLITLDPPDAGIGGGSYEWDGKIFDLGGFLDAPVGVYTYKVKAQHNQGLESCTDQDRSQQLTITGVELGMTYWEPRTYEFQYRIDYYLSRDAAAGSVKIEVFDRTLDKIHSTVSTNHRAGYNCWADAFDTDPTITGPYHFVVYAEETAADGENNRDRQAKAALQKGLINPVYPRASHWQGGGYQYGEDPEGRLEQVVDDTCYQAAVHYVLPDKDAVFDSWERDGIFLLQNHAGPGYTHIAGSQGQAWMVAEDNSETWDPTEDDIVLEDLQENLYPHLYFVQLEGCQTANTSPVFGNLCGQMHHHVGADITLGFTGGPWTGKYSATWEYYFYLYAITEWKWSVQTAARFAAQKVNDEYEDYFGYDTFLIGPISPRDQSLAPARYGLP